jgi:hypothetical protein
MLVLLYAFKHLIFYKKEKKINAMISTVVTLMTTVAALQIFA